MFGWKKIHTSRRNPIKGTLAAGDPSQPPTRWWNHLWLLWFSWEHIVFGVQEEAANGGYRVGYKAGGVAMVYGKVFHDTRFRVRIGHEDCKFFALDAKGKEIHGIKLLAQLSKHDPDCHKDYPLI